MESGLLGMTMVRSMKKAITNPIKYLAAVIVLAVMMIKMASGIGGTEMVSYGDTQIT